MDVDIYKDCDYYIKEVKSDTYKYNVFYVNKDIPLNEKIIKEMEKYTIVDFGDKFNQPIDNLSVFNQEMGKKGLQRLTISKKYTKTLNYVPVSVKIIFSSRF